MHRNLKQVRSTWRLVSKILTPDEVPVPVAGVFYQDIVAAVLLYGSESWVLPPSGLKVEDVHVETARRMTGIRTQTPDSRSVDLP